MARPPSAQRDAKLWQHGNALHLYYVKGFEKQLQCVPVNDAGSQREELLQLGKAHLESLELQRKAYVKARAHAMAQRSSLYARDELEMSVMRIRVRYPHESVAIHEEAFKLHPAEVPVRNKVSSLSAAQKMPALSKCLAPTTPSTAPPHPPPQPLSVWQLGVCGSCTHSAWQLPHAHPSRT